MDNDRPGNSGPKEMDHDSVESLLSALTACTTVTKAYRGHGDSRWRLEPSIVRNPHYQYRKNRSGLDKQDGSVPLENDFLRRFVNACDKAGLRVSGDSERLRSFLDAPQTVECTWPEGDSVEVSNQWPGDSNEMLSLMAQAQHYGVPTRLLDWTTAPLVAAYFAASSALKEWARQPDQRQLANKLTVWELGIDASKKNRRKFEIKQAPGSVSSSLPAQRGLFTLLKGSSIPSLRLEDHPYSDQFLTKHNLSLGHLPQLMWECNRHGHSAATSFPAYEGAAKHAEEVFLIGELRDAIEKSDQEKL